MKLVHVVSGNSEVVEEHSHSRVVSLSHTQHIALSFVKALISIVPRCFPGREVFNNVFI